jgi:hypothetical protein
MANLVLTRPDVFPTGTTVGAYPGNARRADDGPVGAAAIESQAVAASGSATFTTLAQGTPYVFAAQVAGQWRKVQARLSSSATDRGLATGTGNTTNGSQSVASVATTGGAFKVGQAISGLGIPRGTYIDAISGSTLTLTRKATATGTGVALEAAGANTPQAKLRQRRDARGTR